MRTELGSIKSATFGYGGYDDAMIGFAVSLGGDAWGVNDFKGTWGFPPTAHARWTVEDQRNHFAEAVELLRDTLKAAKRKHVAELSGTPIQAYFDGNTLVSWRVLTEIL